MINVAKVSSAGAAFDYYTERDDYYLSDRAAAEWHGTGAADLGLTGEIRASDFRDVLSGQFGAASVGHPDRHTPGWDVTFSAPKSVTLAALLNKDERVTRAHDQAVRTALDHIEKHAIVTRQRGADGDYDFRQTGSMVAGVVRHSTNRNADPQLHSHAVIANITRDPASGKWVSVDSRQGLFAAQTEAGNIYMNELAAACRDAGYTVDWIVRDNGAVSFELREIPVELREAFSTRRQEVDAALSERGATRETASPEEREKATLDTRSPKEHIPGRVLHERWAASAKAQNYEPGTRPEPGKEPHWGARETAAAEAVKAAVAHLSERETRFTERAVLAEARIASQGRARDEDLVLAVRAARDRGELLDRQTLQERPGQKKELVAGYTTREGIQTEARMLRSAERIARSAHGKARIGEKDRGQNQPWHIDAAIRRQEQKTGFAFTSEQRAAVHGIMESDSGLHVIQGHAGTAKTTTALATLAQEAKDAGWKVEAMAPTHSAASTLGEAIGADARTIASTIHQQRVTKPEPDAEKPTGKIWIVDEAGMASARDKEALLAKAEKEQARVILVGDDRQIGSVGAGAAFEQIKASHARDTHELTEIKRQTSDQLRQAVYDSIHGDAKAALDKIEVHEHKDRAQGVQAVADDYMRHAAEGKKTIVVTLSRDDRADVNAAIQQRREAAGEVKDVRVVTTLRDKQWTEAQKADAARYKAGDVIEAGRDFRRGPARGELATVVEVRDGKVTAERANGARWSFDPRKVNKYAVLDRGETRMGAGDRIIAKGAIAARDAKGECFEIKNGTEMTVTRVRDDGRIEARIGKDKRITIDARQGVRADLGYAQTANQAQGRTVDVVIADMRSTQRRLADLQRLYVALSRAREKAIVHTDDKMKLAEVVGRNTGRKETAFAGKLDDARARVASDIRETKSRLATLRQEVRQSTTATAKQPAPNGIPTHTPRGQHAATPSAARQPPAPKQDRDRGMNG